MVFSSLRNLFFRAKGRACPRSGRKAVRPRLEQLEDRYVTSGFAVGAGGDDTLVAHVKSPRPHVQESVIDGHILKLVGDNMASHIQIADQGERGIRVAIDDGEFIWFLGIDQVVVSTGAGHDTLQYELDGPNTTPADLSVQLGSGTDTVVVDARHGWAGPRPWQVTVTGGNDYTGTFLLGDGRGGLNLEDQLAAKKSTVHVMIDAAQATGGAGALWNMNFLGTGGADSVHALIGILRPPTPGDRAALETPVNLHFDAGADPHSALSVEYANVTIQAPQTLALTGIQADAALQMRLHNVLVTAPLSVAFSSLGGGEAASIHGIFINSLPGGRPMDGRLTMNSYTKTKGDPAFELADWSFSIANESTIGSGTPGAGAGKSTGKGEIVTVDGDTWSVLFKLIP
jgi:hypothetical protein